MRTVFEVFLVILLAAIAILYFRIKQENIRVQKIAGYLSVDAREQVDERWQFLTDRIKCAKASSEKSENPQIDTILVYLEKLRTVRDSAQIRLRHIDSLENDSDKAVAYNKYKYWLYKKKGYFFHGSEYFVWIFAPVLGLDKGLFPESLITIEHLHATHISTLILEDALSYAIWREAEQTMSYCPLPCP